ncbi:stage III sporulation protein SpoIIIAB [Paenibacillus pasadenensis]|uniref:stage III sporulation protein SpoIIIAB n=1 Tax=Paenibacillus pasadenensis TaxID=217090 RepID=UPI0020402144|nr:stage III sporulation protein SpoIIIAB [Paenibacillus pasadenensis]
MIKAIGAVLVLVAGTLIGFIQAARFAKRPQQLRELAGGLQRLETEIGYGYTPLPEALKRIAAPMAEPLASMLRAPAERIEDGSSADFQAGWEEAISSYGPLTALKQPELTALRRLGSILGMSDREDQLKHLKLAQQQLLVEESGARDDQARYEKLSRGLGILIAALVVILIV